MKKVPKLAWIGMAICALLASLDFFVFVSVWENHALASSSAWIDFEVVLTSLGALVSLIVLFVVVLKRSQPPPPPPNP
jgi:hypothetical protein